MHDARERAIKIVNTHIYLVTRTVPVWEMCESSELLRDVLNLIKNFNNNPHSSLMRTVAATATTCIDFNFQQWVGVCAVPYAAKMQANCSHTPWLWTGVRCHQYHRILYRQCCHSFSFSVFLVKYYTLCIASPYDEHGTNALSSHLQFLLLLASFHVQRVV